jgi:pimeloyl-ACP methyl ester carboxylesterase
MFKIESLLSARLFLQPQTAGDIIYFLSNISGHLSLYKMKIGGSVPQPLLPPDIALQNPHLIDGYSFAIFPKLKKILVMIDKDGDENYQPMFIPIGGGYPEEILGGYFNSYRCHLGNFDAKQNIFYLANEEKKKPESAAFQVNLNKNSVIELFRSSGFAMAVCNTVNHKKIAIIEAFSVGDEILYLWESGKSKKTVLLGTPISDRKPDERIQLTGINGASFTKDENGILISSAIYSDTYSVGYLDLKNKKGLKRVKIKGLIHSGKGELEGISGLKEDQFTLSFNIDGISWLYQVSWKKDKKLLKVERTICGGKPLENGTLESFNFNPKKDQYALSFSSADLPTQILLVEVKTKTRHRFQTIEQVLGIPDHFLSAGEDASFESYDGLRMSARLYLPCKDLGFKGPRPLVYYVHGGPQGQERPDFAWFSMPLIQYLTLKGFAVFVPNVRGSTGYGLAYTKLVDRDWGGNDRLDHVHALKILATDERVDTKRAGVVGRSYGGYMSLMLAGRHPELWRAAVDMFGPYDLLTFLERIPESWKPIMKESLGDTVSDRDFLVERSPKTYLGNMTCPLLVIQGSHDPRVVALESQDLVDSLKAQGKKIDFILFEDEGHDVLKYKNRVRCYEAITEFLIKTLKPEK